MTINRAGAVTLQGNPFSLVGPELKSGDSAPDFELVNGEMKPVKLADTHGTVRIFSVVPSLDTPVCDAQTRRFNQEAGGLAGVQIYTISMDLPFAQNRWCAAAAVDKLTMLSDHRTASFGTAYGTLVKELRLNCRAIFVLNAEDTIRHVEYVKEIASHPDYDSALAAVRNTAGL